MPRELQPTHKIDHIAVLVPARDEEALLPRCLSSLFAARQRLPQEVTCEIVVAVDCSTDSTQQLAHLLLGDSGSVVSSDAGVVGVARAVAARHALSRYHGAAQRCWLANTDADCAVPESWLMDHLRLAHTGAHAVAGTVDVEDFSEHGSRVAALFRQTYLIHPDGTHPHIHGANLGVRADAYLRAGGWSSLSTAEDHDLWNRLGSHGFRRLSTARCQVVTSGRRVGRAPHGFAQALAAHNEVLA